MSKRHKVKNTIRIGKIVKSHEIDPFAGSPKADYSGFGFHGQDRRAARRQRNLEEKRVQKGDYED